MNFLGAANMLFLTGAIFTISFKPWFTHAHEGSDSVSTVSVSIAVICSFITLIYIRCCNKSRFIASLNRRSSGPFYLMSGLSWEIPWAVNIKLLNNTNLQINTYSMIYACKIMDIAVLQIENWMFNFLQNNAHLIVCTNEWIFALVHVSTGLSASRLFITFFTFLHENILCMTGIFW